MNNVEIASSLWGIFLGKLRKTLKKTQFIKSTSRFSQLVVCSFIRCFDFIKPKNKNEPNFYFSPCE